MVAGVVELTMDMLAVGEQPATAAVDLIDSAAIAEVLVAQQTMTGLQYWDLCYDFGLVVAELNCHSQIALRETRYHFEGKMTPKQHSVSLKLQ